MLTLENIHLTSMFLVILLHALLILRRSEHKDIIPRGETTNIATVDKVDMLPELEDK